MPEEKNQQSQSETTEVTEDQNNNSSAQPAEGDPDAGTKSGESAEKPVEG